MPQNPFELFTQHELCDALAAATRYDFGTHRRIFKDSKNYSFSQADNLVQIIKENRRKARKVREMEETEEFTFTESELRAAYKHIGYSITHSSRVIDAVKALREPEYPAGTVVTDAVGLWWKLDNDRKWMSFGDDSRVDYTAIARPITVKS